MRSSASRARTAVLPMGGRGDPWRVVVMLATVVLLAGIGAVAAASSAAQEAQPEGSWSDGEWFGVVPTGRDEETAARLPDGRVLVAAGDSPQTADSSIQPYDSGEIYDPDERRWSLTAPMANERRRHTATSLDDGRVLVAGGQGCHELSGNNCVGAHTSAEVFDPDGEEWTAVASMAEGRDAHAAVRLDDGRVLVAGGYSSGARSPRHPFDGEALNSVEIYDPEQDDEGAWETVASMDTARGGQAAVVLDDGRVLVAGGVDSDRNSLDSAEVYDPDADEWQTVESMGDTRDTPIASLLDDGRVLVAGGGTASAEIYDDGQWESAASMDTARRGSATVLDDGTVLVVDGSAERYDPAADQWWATDQPEHSRTGSTVTVLDNGDVLATARERAEVYRPETTPTPVVTSVTPEQGTVDGGTEVTITGEHLDETVMVRFRHDHAREFEQVSSEEVTAVTPEHEARDVHVRVTTPGGTSEPSEGGSFTFEAADASWTPIGDVNESRNRAGLVVLDGPACDADEQPDYCGKVLVIGGYGSAGSVELFDPRTAEFASCDSGAGNAACPEPLPWGTGDNMKNKVQLLDGPECRGETPPDYCGKILAVHVSNAGLYDPAAGTWENIGTDDDFEGLQALVLLDGAECRATSPPDHCGELLAPGGSVDPSWTYDPGADEWTERESYDGTFGGRSFVLVDGEVCEGSEPPEACGQVFALAGFREAGSAELYDPSTGTWNPAPTPGIPDREPHYVHTAMQLRDGRTLFAGGWRMTMLGCRTGVLSDVEAFEPEANDWIGLASLARPRMDHGDVMLPDGRVLLSGGNVFTDARECEGAASAEIFDPEAGQVGEWSYTASMHTPRRVHSMVLLPEGPEDVCGDNCGKVLAVGGRSPGTIASAELFALAGAVTGEVTDAETESPVSEAELTVVDADGDEVAAAASGGDGAYALDPVQAGSYTVTAAAEGYNAASQEVTVGSDETVTVDFALDAIEPGAVTGGVTDAASGEAIEGAEVTLSDDGGSATTDSDGAYAIDEVEVGAYTVTVVADGYESATQDVEVEDGETLSLDFALDPIAAELGVVGGEVSDADSGEAIEGAEVTLSGGAGSATTDEDGAYEITEVSPDAYTVSADADGYESAIQEVDVNAGEAVTVDFALTAIEEPDVPTDPELARLDGATRIHTAARVAERGYPDGADTVVVARGDDYADALAGAPLAHNLGAPVLLTFPDDLHDVTAEAIDDLGADGAVLLGGTAAISDDVADELHNSGLEVTRLSGPTRFHTAAEVAGHVGGDGQAIVAEGAHEDDARGWPDPLSASPLAAAEQRPILLAVHDTVPDATAEALEDLNVTETLVVGGTAAVSDDVESWLAEAGHGPQRVSGPTRYATSAAVHELMVDAGLDADRVWLATGRAFPDALAAGPTVAALGESLMLADTDDLANSQPTTDRLEARESLTTLVLLGGEAALSDHIETQLNELLEE